jgi:hypothetical protein
MLYLSIFTYEPEKRDEVIKRRFEKGAMLPEGAKLLGEWTDTQGGRSFRLQDVPDAKTGFAATLAWSDLGKIEVVPVLETEEAMGLASGK